MRRARLLYELTQSRSDLNAIKADRSPGCVMEFHIRAGARVCGHGDPVRREQSCRALDDVSFAGNAGPVNHTILALQRSSLVSGHLENRFRVGRVSAGDVFLPVTGPIAIGVGAGLRKQIVNTAKVAQAPGIRNAVIEGGRRPIRECDQA